MHIRKALVSLLLIISSIGGHGVAVAGESFAEFAQDMSYTGATFATKNIRGVTNLDIRINENKLLAAIPALQQAGLLNPDLNQTAINLMPISLSSVLAQEISLAALMSMYQDPQVNQIHVTSYLEMPDDYGNMESHLMHSFSFDRKLYRRINWQNFQPDKLAKVAPGFKYSRWALSKVAKEQE
jgi:hypothetical protein